MPCRSKRVNLAVCAVTMTLATAACGDAVPTESIDGPCPGAGGVVFVLSGSLHSASPPFAPSDPVSGCLRIAEEAATAANVSEVAEDILGYRVRVGIEVWTGDGLDLVTPPRPPPYLLLPSIRVQFAISADGTRLAFIYGRGLLTSIPGALYFTFESVDTDLTELLVESAAQLPHEVAVGTVQFTRLR